VAQDPGPITGDFAVSPHFARSHFGDSTSFEQEIALFADVVRGLQLDVAERLIAADPHSGMAVLSISTSYFEMIAKCREGYTGAGDAGKFFKKGLGWVLESMAQPLPDRDKRTIERVLWREVRNGLYHAAVVGGAVVLTRANPEMVMGTKYPASGAEVHINPEALVRVLQQHFSGYVLDLLNPANEELRASFMRRFGIMKGAAARVH